MNDQRERYAFGGHELDVARASLTRDGQTVPIQPRAFDLLVQFLRNPETIQSKDQLFDTVWPGVTVGDEALTQAVKELRKALGDDAADPRFIETVPRRGYRFIAPARRTDAPPAESSAPADRLRRAVVSGTLGGGAAGLVGGLVFGAIAGSGSEAALVILAVMTSITIAIATLGAFGLSLGMALASRIGGRDFTFSILGAVLGGFVVGDLFHLLASGSFSLFLGTPHGDFTGGLEGAILGGSIAAGARLGGGVTGRWPRPVIGGGLAGAAGGALIGLADGNLMASSLAGLARRFHGSMLDLGLFAQLAGENGGALAIVTAAGEGLLLGSFMVAAILLRSRENQRALS